MRSSVFRIGSDFKPGTLDVIISYITSILTCLKEYAANALTQLSLFGMEETVVQLLGGEVNSLLNVITMDSTLHSLFDNFSWWLEEVADEVGSPYSGRS